MTLKPRWKSTPVFILVVVAAYFAVFLHLDALNMRVWDESSYALNAQEMLERKNPIEVYLLGQPDTYNSKPPFAIWCMAAGIYTFGFNELGVRIAAALFTFLAAIGLWALGRYKLESNVAALAMPLVFISSSGFMGEHIARTGDTDAILAFWIGAACVFLYLFSEAERPSRQRLFFLLSAASLTLACLTKGIAGLTPLPGMLVWLLYTRKLIFVLKKSYFYIGLLMFMLFPGYYVLRNILTPGYLDAVMHFEIGGRLSRQEFLNPEPRGFFYFLEAMFTESRFMPWVLALPVAMFWTFGAKEKTPLKRAALFFLIASLGVTFSLGMSSTKLFWYDAPMYPLMAAFIGSALALLVSHMEQYYKWSVVLFFLVFFSLPYNQILQRNFASNEDAHLSDFLTRLRRDKQVKDTLYLIDNDYNFSVYFYAKQQQLEGYVSYYTLVYSPELTPGKLIVTSKYAREYDMNRMFVLDTLDSYEECRYYRIKSIRQQ